MLVQISSRPRQIAFRSAQIVIVVAALALLIAGVVGSAPVVADSVFTGGRRTSPTLALVGAVSVLSGAMMLRTSRRRRTT